MAAMLTQLDKWRHMIEPVIAESATPMPWDQVLEQNVAVYAGVRSVVVTRPGHVRGRPACLIWVAAGEFDEVARLIEEVKESARTAGMDQVAYLGRRGWTRALGFQEVAVIAVKEI